MGLGLANPNPNPNPNHLSRRASCTAEPAYASTPCVPERWTSVGGSWASVPDESTATSIVRSLPVGKVRVCSVAFAPSAAARNLALAEE